MTVTVNMGSAKDFMYWDADKQAFKIDSGAATTENVGTHKVCMKVVHFNATYHEEYNDCFTVTIKPPIVKPWIPPMKEDGRPPSTQQLIISDFGLEKGPYNPRQPIPYIADLSITGVLRIGWDRTMTERPDFETINPSRVAVNATDVIKTGKNLTEAVDLTDARVQNSSIGSRRQLAYRHKGLYLNETTLEKEWLLVVEALELRMNAGDYSDENALNLTWSMIDFNKDQITIQLYFEYPQRVSEYIEYDTLEVYFWGVDWFRSSKGEPVRYGTKLQRPILR